MYHDVPHNEIIRVVSLPEEREAQRFADHTAPAIRADEIIERRRFSDMPLVVRSRNASAYTIFALWLLKRKQGGAPLGFAAQFLQFRAQDLLEVVLAQHHHVRLNTSQCREPSSQGSTHEGALGCRLCRGPHVELCQLLDAAWHLVHDRLGRGDRAAHDLIADAKRAEEFH